MLTTLVAALGMAAVLGRALGVEPRLRTLVGVGTAICGASAIGAVSGVIAATEAEVAYAVSTIFVYNVAAVLLFPGIGHLLSLGQHAFGLWAGTAINDTSSVVAAAYPYGHEAGDYAVVVKLTRTTMIIPIALSLAAYRVITSRVRTRPPLHRLFPTFLIWFVAAAGIESAGLIGAGSRHVLAVAGVTLITVALAAVGLSTRFGAIRSTGVRPLLLGGALWALVGATGLLVQEVPWGRLT
jgi:uncharacterized integral membrane protein (TIGR00698 family)